MVLDQNLYASDAKAPRRHARSSCIGLVLVIATRPDRRLEPPQLGQEHRKRAASR